MDDMLGYEVGARAPPDGGKGASAMMFAGRPPNDATKSRPPFLRFSFVRFLALGSTIRISFGDLRYEVEGSCEYVVVSISHCSNVEITTC